MRFQPLVKIVAYCFAIFPQLLFAQLIADQVALTDAFQISGEKGTIEVVIIHPSYQWRADEEMVRITEHAEKQALTRLIVDQKLKDRKFTKHHNRIPLLFVIQGSPEEAWGEGEKFLDILLEQTRIQIDHMNTGKGVSVIGYQERLAGVSSHPTLTRLIDFVGRTVVTPILEIHHLGQTPWTPDRIIQGSLAVHHTNLARNTTVHLHIDSRRGTAPLFQRVVMPTFLEGHLSGLAEQDRMRGKIVEHGPESSGRPQLLADYLADPVDLTKKEAGAFSAIAQQGQSRRSFGAKVLSLSTSANKGISRYGENLNEPSVAADAELETMVSAEQTRLQIITEQKFLEALRTGRWSQLSHVEQREATRVLLEVSEKWSIDEGLRFKLKNHADPMNGKLAIESGALSWEGKKLAHSARQVREAMVGLREVMREHIKPKVRSR